MLSNPEMTLLQHHSNIDKRVILCNSIACRYQWLCLNAIILEYQPVNKMSSHWRL